MNTEYKMYPISAVMNGGGSLNGPTYDVCDLRNGGILLATQNTLDELKPVLHTLNTNLEEGMYDKDARVIKDDALLLVLGINTVPEAQEVPEETAPEENKVSERTKQVHAPGSLSFIAPLEPLAKL